MLLFLFLKRKKVLQYVLSSKYGQLEKHVHPNIDSKLLDQRDTHFGRYRVTVIILSFNVTLWKVRPILSQYWSSSSGRFLDTRPTCKKQNTPSVSLLQLSELCQQTVPIETDSRIGLLNSRQTKSHLSGHLFKEHMHNEPFVLTVRIC